MTDDQSDLTNLFFTKVFVLKLVAYVELDKIMLNKNINVIIRGFGKVLRFLFSSKGTRLPGSNYTQGANSIKLYTMVKRATHK